MVNRVLRGVTITLVIVALAFSVALLAKDAGMGTLLRLPRSIISALSLSLVGVAFLIVQLVIRPRAKEFLRNMLLAATFVLWGVVQLMTQNILSIRLGNFVVALFVLDLAWAVLLSVRPAQISIQPRVGPANCPPDQSSRHV
jgi:hypothetical protein